jgi:long-chain acyl-CoA synthetase
MKLSEPVPESTYMFCYTSGTTGDPKGAMIQHKDIIANLNTEAYFNFDLTEKDVSLSYLPYAHIFE